jgi:hypothetical protein
MEKREVDKQWRALETERNNLANAKQVWSKKEKTLAEKETELQKREKDVEAKEDKLGMESHKIEDFSSKLVRMER